MTERVRCPKCAKQVLSATLIKYGGVCRHCVRSKGGLRTAAIALAIFSMACFVWQWVFEVELAAAIANGKEMKEHFFIAAVFNNFGLTGTRFLFVGLGSVGLFFTARFTRAWLAERRHVQAVTKNAISN